MLPPDPTTARNQYAFAVATMHALSAAKGGAGPSMVLQLMTTWSPQIIFPASAEGMSAKLNIGRLATTDRGFWLLPFWRERSGPPCWNPAGAAYGGVPGVFQSTDQVATPHSCLCSLLPALSTTATSRAAWARFWLVQACVSKPSWQAQTMPSNY